VKLLLDTQLLLWSAQGREHLPARAGAMLDDPANVLLFSIASLWEIVIKNALGRSDFKVDARLLRRALIDNGYQELPVLADHVLAIQSLPPIHRDPFDRVLLAQAMVEGITLLTSDQQLALYPGPICSAE
jgi:PIN domain nuclease of toxin-antitoxin system